MAEMNYNSKTKQIKSLLCVFGAGLITAILLSLALLYYYSPPGTYLAKNVLLMPQNVANLSFVDPATKSKERVIFDQFDFSYYDAKAKRRVIIEISQGQYTRFYELVQNEKSLMAVEESIIQGFQQGSQASLALMVGNNAHTYKSVFSEVEFSNQGDYYRVQLRQQNSSGDDWAYFYHPGIYQKVITLFTL